MRTIEGAPLGVIEENDDPSIYLGRTDVIVIARRWRSDGRLVFLLPQFDIEIVTDTSRGDTPTESDDLDRVSGELTDRLLRKLAALYAALIELPSDYINDVERWQLEIFHKTLAPWLLAQVGRHPEYFAMPPIDQHLVGA